MNMKDGTKKSRFKTVTPVMIYLPIELNDQLKRFVKKSKLSGSKVASEGIAMRLMGDDDPYHAGFNGGLNEAMRIVKDTEGAKMMFPSGKSFGQLVCEEIERYIREKKG